MYSMELEAHNLVVRDLKWHQNGQDVIVANGAHHTFEIWGPMPATGNFCWSASGSPWQITNTLEQAKQACNEHNASWVASWIFIKESTS